MVLIRVRGIGNLSDKGGNLKFQGSLKIMVSFLLSGKSDTMEETGLIMRSTQKAPSLMPMGIAMAAFLDEISLSSRL